MAKKRSNGEGSVFWNTTLKRYTASVTIGRNENGKPLRKNFYGPRGDKSNAAKLGVQAKMEPFVNGRIKISADSLGAIVHQYIDTAQIAPKTRYIYETAVKHLDADPIAAERLHDIEPIDIKKFYERMQTGDTMKQKVHRLVHRVFEEALRMEMIWRNPASKVPKPKVTRRKMAVWTPEQLVTFLTAAEASPYYALFLLSLTSTMGPAEMFALRKSNVHLIARYVVVEENLVTVRGKVHHGDTKTGFRRRRIDLPQITIDALADRMKRYPKGDLVFTSPKGKPIRGNNFIRNVWNPLIEAAKVPRIRMYDMRHTANALMGYLGVPLEVAKERMGHSSIKTTSDVYGHLYESMQQETARKLEAFFDAVAIHVAISDAARPESEQ